MLPVKWMPPEAFLDGVFTSKTDVWLDLCLSVCLSLSLSVSLTGRQRKSLMKSLAAAEELLNTDKDHYSSNFTQLQYYNDSKKPMHCAAQLPTHFTL